MAGGALKHPVARRVLVTGAQGLVGAAVMATLRDGGWDPAGFDLRSGSDVRDGAALGAAMAGAGAVVHLAALPSDHHPPEQIMSVNVLGTTEVLLAAARAGPARVVFMSSAQALGVFEGHRRADYLPLDDRHPTHAARPYALSKRVAEDLCARFSAETAIPTLCLRPPLVLDDGRRAWLEQSLSAPGRDEGKPFWEYGAFLHVEDLAAAVRAGLEAELPVHRRLLLCAADVCSATGHPSRELARRLAPDVPWRGGREYELEPFRALVDCSGARALLDWAPRRGWRVPCRHPATAP